MQLALAAYNNGPERISKDGQNIKYGAKSYSDNIYIHLKYLLDHGKCPIPVPATHYNANRQ